MEKFKLLLNWGSYLVGCSTSAELYSTFAFWRDYCKVSIADDDC